MGTESWRVNPSVIVQLVLLSFTPILLVLSHRNVAGQLILMGIAAALYPGAFASFTKAFQVKTLFRPSPASVFLWALLFCFYTAITVLWTPVPDRWAWSVQLTLFVLGAGAVLWCVTSVDSRDTQRLSQTYIIGVFIACLVLGFEGLSGGWIRDLIPPDGRADKEIIATARGAGLVLYFVIPVALFFLMDSEPGSAFGRRLRALLFFVLVASAGTAAALLDVSANILAFAAALVAGAAGYLWPRTAIKIILAAILAFVLIVPFLALMLPPIDQLATAGFLPASWVQRLIAWRLSADHIFSSPGSFLFGGGLNYSWMLARLGEAVHVSGWPTPLPVMPVHPHNLALQVWLEFGLAGVVLAAAALAQCLRYIVTRSFSAPASASICALSLVAFVFACTEVNLWTLWRLSGFVLGIVGLILIFRQDSQNFRVEQ